MMKIPKINSSVQFLTLLVCLLMGLFWLFFDQSKHLPFLSEVNPFSEDPYDAVGSFGIQLGVLFALLAVLRLIRPRPQSMSGHELQTLLNANVVALASIFVTMLADLTAMARFPDLWIHKPAGWVLAGLVSGLWIAACLAGGWVTRLEKSRNALLPPGSSSWRRRQAVFGLGIGVAILYLYPPSWWNLN